jgi:hypothetical protein
VDAAEKGKRTSWMIFTKKQRTTTERHNAKVTIDLKNAVIMLENS